MFSLMTTWYTGRALVAQSIRRNDIGLQPYVEGVQRSKHPPVRVPGTAVYLFSTPGLTPPAMVANVRHNDVLHAQVVVLAIETALTPRVLPAKRSRVQHLGEGIHQVILRYGFLEDPDVPRGLAQGDAAKLAINSSTAAYFLGAESVSRDPNTGMATWREHLFVFLSRNATPAAAYFGLPADRTLTLARAVTI
jgi:KUP system potassium uptake protein